GRRLEYALASRLEQWCGKCIISWKDVGRRRRVIRRLIAEQYGLRIRCRRRHRAEHDRPGGARGRGTGQLENFAPALRRLMVTASVAIAMAARLERLEP